jgi:hypothetical protein
MIKALKKLVKEGIYLKIIKSVYDKPLGNLLLNGEKPEIISPKVRNKTRCKISSFLFNIVLKFIARTTRQ